MVQPIDKLEGYPDGVRQVIQYFQESVNWHVWQEDGDWCLLYLRNLVDQPCPVHMLVMSEYGDIVIYRCDDDPTGIDIDTPATELYDIIVKHSGRNDRIQG